MSFLDPDVRYERFVFAAPEAEPHAWALSYGHVEEALNRTDPRARFTLRTSPLRHTTYASYRAAFPFGRFEGTASPDPDYMTLALATLDTAAGFAAWLRTDIVPPGAAIKFNYLAGIESGIPPGTIPDTMDTDALRAVLEQFVRAV